MSDICLRCKNPVSLCAHDGSSPLDQESYMYWLESHIISLRDEVKTAYKEGYTRARYTDPRFETPAKSWAKSQAKLRLEAMSCE